MTTVLEGLGLRRVFTGGDGKPIVVLDGADLSVSAGEFVAVVGASGCGKSTLLHLLGGLDRPDAGTVRLEGVVLGSLSSDALAEVRNRRVGFVFQFHHLLRDFTALENVMMPLLVGGTAPATASHRANEVLEEVGLAARATSRVTVLSGGEQQRVALARAIVTDPAILLADEPTGNLDPSTGARVHELLAGLARRRGTAVIAVTHNPVLAGQADRVLALEAGHLRAAVPGEQMS
jgi:lipoprotein-releasing system ATP-binding protein